MDKKSNKYFIYDSPYQNGIKAFIKKLIYHLNAFVWKLRMTSKKDIVKKKYKVSICAIFKNEALYLKEWITYHNIVGIDHFYMYNNNSEDAFREVLQPFIDNGMVTLIEWPYAHAQMEAYQDSIKRFKNETMWMGFIDIDEFIVPKSTDDVYSFLEPFEKKYGSIIIYWKLYGSSGNVNRNSDRLVVEDFTVCWPKYCDIGKSFYNTNFDFDEKSEKNKIFHHKFWAKSKGRDIPPVNIFGKVCIGNLNIASNSEFPIQINHYFTKSYQEYATKRAKGDVYFKVNPHDEAYFYYHEMLCSDVDYSAYKYLIKLKLAMEDGFYNGQAI